MWWGLVRGKTECNAVSLHLRWKITYRMIQWLDLDAQLAGWVAHYFAYIYIYIYGPSILRPVVD
jgi:hypothetical protein